MDKVLLYSIIDAPPPPDWMIEHAKEENPYGQGKLTENVMNDHGDAFTHRPLYKDGNVYTNSFNWSTYMNDQSLAWAKKHVTDVTKDIRSVNTTPGRFRNGPHTDRSRNYTLMYLLEAGGPDHETVFYKECGQKDLVRPRATHVDDYTKVEKIASFRLEVNRWNLVQGLVLHSIENIPEGRFSIQLSLDEIPDELVLENPVYISL